MAVPQEPLRIASGSSEVTRCVPSTTPPCATGSSAWSTCCDGWPSRAPAPSATPGITWVSSPSSTWPTRARSGVPNDAGDEILRAPAEGSMRATFDALFDLMRAAADQPEAVELVLAGGLLHAPDQDVRVHLLARPVRIEHDGDEMVVTLAGEAARWEHEELLAGTGLVDDAAPGEDVTPASPLDPDLVDVLAGWADRHLRVEHARGDDWIAPTGPGTALVPAPTIVARRRGAAALRTFYDAIVADLADTERPLPVGLAQLVEAIEPADRAAWLARTGHDEAPVVDPLFPLPVGAAQGRILSRLGRDSGVVVEGPPGTGKTHTIANLLCALLAEGRRVLVTSEKAQALRVLRDKLPPEMRDLCISLAEGPDGGDPGLGAGIAGLEARSTEFDPDEADRTIAELVERRDGLRADRDAALDALVAERAAETSVQRDLGPGMTGTRTEVARRVLAARAQDGWLADVVGPRRRPPDRARADHRRVRRAPRPARHRDPGPPRARPPGAPAPGGAAAGEPRRRPRRDRHPGPGRHQRRRGRGRGRARSPAVRGGRAPPDGQPAGDRRTRRARGHRRGRGVGARGRRRGALRARRAPVGSCGRRAARGGRGARPRPTCRTGPGAGRRRRRPRGRGAGVRALRGVPRRRRHDEAAVQARGAEGRRAVPGVDPPAGRSAVHGLRRHRHRPPPADPRDHRPPGRGLRAARPSRAPRRAPRDARRAGPRPARDVPGRRQGPHRGGRRPAPALRPAAGRAPAGRLAGAAAGARHPEPRRRRHPRRRPRPQRAGGGRRARPGRRAPGPPGARADRGARGPAPPRRRRLRRRGARGGGGARRGPRPAARRRPRRAPRTRGARGARPAARARGRGVARARGALRPGVGVRAGRGARDAVGRGRGRPGPPRRPRRRARAGHRPAGGGPGDGGRACPGSPPSRCARCRATARRCPPWAGVPVASPTATAPRPARRSPSPATPCPRG